MSSPRPLKRSCSDAGLDHPGLDTVSDSMAKSAREASPSALDSRIMSSSTPAMNPSPPNSSLNPQTSLTPNAPEPSATTVPSQITATVKRTLLTASEKAAKRLEKEAKEKEKADQKQKKEEERLRKEKEKEVDRFRKDREKARKDEEKRARDAEKEQKRREKEQQNKIKEEEQRKKQRSQFRLNAFFVPPSLTNDGSTPSPNRGSPSPANSRRSSIISLDGHDALFRERSISATPSKPKNSEYERRFPSFFLHSHTTLALPNRFERDEEGLQYARKLLDDKLVSGSMSTDVPAPYNPIEILHVSPHKRRKLNRHQTSVKEIVDQLHGTSQKPIDLTDPQRFKASQQPLDLLKSVSIKILKFAEDVRPPYIGTYSRVQDPMAARKMCRNPFTRGLPSTVYDYDSEAEWEDPGEGEDLDSEGEEEAESEDGDEMEGFLDDEEDGTKLGQKRRLLAGDLEPSSTGLCWEDGHHIPMRSELALYRLEVILDNTITPIDPYSTAYWQTTVFNSAPAPSSRTLQPVMDPPRIPLNTTNRTNFLIPNSTLAPDGLKPLPLNANSIFSSKAPQAAKRMVTPEVLEDFKRAVKGSDLTKAGLIEILKKKFPKQSKDAIKDTLSTVAERAGMREKDKRWVIKS